MKKLKKIFLLLFMLTPLFVLAEGPSAQEKLALLPTYEKGGKEYLDINIMDYSAYSNVKVSNEWEDGDENKVFAAELIKLSLEEKGVEFMKKIGNEMFENYFYEFDDVNDLIRIAAKNGYSNSEICYEGSGGMTCSNGWPSFDEMKTYASEYYKVKELYIEHKSKISDNNIENIISQLNGKKFELTGNMELNLMASIPNYDINTIGDSNMKLLVDYFPELKALIEKNESYKFSISGTGSGGDWYWDAGKNIGIYKNDLLLGVSKVRFFSHSTIMVPEGEGTLLERANSILKKEFPENNKPIFELADDGINWMEPCGNPGDPDYYNPKDDFTLTMNEFYGLSKITYDTLDIIVTLNGNNQRFILSEIPESKYTKYNTQSKNYGYDISIESGGYDVPGDAHLNVDDLSNDQTIKENGKKNNYFVEKVYDLKLKRGYDGSYVEQTPLGTNVYVPISGHKEGDKVRVFYVKDKEFQPEEIIGTVVKKDGKKYLNFVTTHFSVFAIEGTKNPQTGDNLNLFIYLSLIPIYVFIILITYKNYIKERL